MLTREEFVLAAFWVTVTLIAAATSFAQSANGPITGAQVKAQLVEAEQQGARMGI